MSINPGVGAGTTGGGASRRGAPPVDGTLPPPAIAWLELDLTVEPAADPPLARPLAP